MSAPSQPVRSSPEIFFPQPSRAGVRRAGAAEEVPRASLAAVALDAVVVLPSRDRSEKLNRLVNIVLAGLLIIALCPVLLIVAMAVKLTSPGPVFYTQTRVGLDRRRRRPETSAYDRRVRDLGGSVFRIYKFRSMRADAERGTGAVWAQRSDPRVTPLGRFLRKTRLDEVPQLINVLRGDMNIVGPRPERPSIVHRLREDIDEYLLRHRTRPGITGWAQINQSYDTTLDDVRSKVRYDIEYLRRQGMAMDVRIMLLTIPVVLFRKGGW